MKIGIFITARLGSTRLKKKHLIPILGRPILDYLLQRIQNEFRKELDDGEISLIITTSDEPENRAFEKLSNVGLQVFYGSKSNIPLRHLQCIENHRLDGVIAVDGDDILCSVTGMRHVYNALKVGNLYVKTTGLPFGMNSSGYSSDFLQKALQGHSRETLETGWGRIFDESKIKTIAFSSATQSDYLRFTLDYEEDFEFFKAVIQSLQTDINTVSDDAIISIVTKNRLFDINRKLLEQYWSNFQQNLKSEIASS